MSVLLGTLPLLLNLGAQWRCRRFMQRYGTLLGKADAACPGPLFCYPQLTLLLLEAALTLAAAALCGQILLAAAATALVCGIFFGIDYLKFKVLHEPLVWSDLYLIREIILCPRLYFSYVGWQGWTAMILAAAGLSCSLAVCPSAPASWTALTRLGLAAAAAACGAAWCAMLYAGRRRHPLQGDALSDGALLSPGYAFILQWLVKARDDALLKDRGAEALLASHSSAGTSPAPATLCCTCPGGRAQHILIVQAESFCDLRRFALGQVPLKVLQRRDVQHLGLLDIDYLGAYTMRSEFAVLTGLHPRQLGAYAYNPYLLARSRPLESMASRAHAAGYTTLCVHPNYGAFFARKQVMANLGFEHFVDLQSLPALRRDGCHVSDEALLGWVAAYLQQHAAERLFVFIITMQAHGPWRRHDCPALTLPAPAPALPSSLRRSEREALAIYEHHLAALDRGLNRLLPALRPCDMLIMYGDHLPAITALPRQAVRLNAGPGSLRPDVLAYHARAEQLSTPPQQICYNKALRLDAVFKLVCSCTAPSDRADHAASPAHWTDAVTGGGESD